MMVKALKLKSVFIICVKVYSSTSSPRTVIKYASYADLLCCNNKLKYTKISNQKYENDRSKNSLN